MKNDKEAAAASQVTRMTEAAWLLDYRIVLSGDGSFALLDVDYDLLAEWKDADAACSWLLSEASKRVADEEEELTAMQARVGRASQAREFLGAGS